MRLGTYLAALVALFALSTPVLGAKNEEVVQYPSFFIVEDFFQSAGLFFSYIRNKDGSDTSSSKGISSMYTLVSDVDILNPHLVAMRVDGGIMYSDQLRNPSSTLLTGRYNIVANCFDLSYHPLSMVATRNTELVTDGYTPTYSVTNTFDEVNLSFLNVMFPLQLFYAHSTYATQGLPEDSTSSSDRKSVV